MKYKLLGRSGLKVSEISLGTMTFGTEWGWGSGKQESQEIFNAYLEKGGNFIDTANFYTNGSSEEYIGEFMQSQRQKIVLATKYSLSTDPKNPNAGGNNRKNMHEAIDASLKRLKTDYIDLYWVHAWDYTSPIEEVMRALDDMVRAGKILYVGISDTPAWQIARSNMLAELRGWSPFVAVQLEYSLIERTIEPEFYSMLNELDLSLAAWSPLAMGVLTGKYLNQNGEAKRGDMSPEFMAKYYNTRVENIVRKVLEVAKQAGRSPAQVAIKWVLQKRPYNIPIIGAKNLKQLQDNLDSTTFELTDEQMKLLDEASAIPLPFPHEFLTSPFLKKTLFGEHYDLIESHRH